MKRPELPERDDLGIGWPPGYLDARLAYDAERERVLRDLRLADERVMREAELARLTHEVARAELLARLSQAEPPASQPEPGPSHVADQAEQSEPQTPLEHAQAIMACQPAISIRDLAGALTAALGGKVGRTRAANLASQVRAGTSLRAVAG